MRKTNEKLIQTLNEVHRSIERLDKNIKRQNSFKRNFLLSIVRGVGYFIGATIVAGLAIAIMFKFLMSLDRLPFINQAIDVELIEETLEPNFEILDQSKERKSK
ncbi:MAG: DUF5665 domain-containing protein [Candidatus Woesebacteria bacterium]|jgi:hypothetical protein